MIRSGLGVSDVNDLEMNFEETTLAINNFNVNLNGNFGTDVANVIV